MKVLDIGCGSDDDATTVKGWLLQNFADVQVTGVDIRPGKADIIADAHSLAPIPDASYDVVSMSEVLEHLESPTKALGAAHRVLKDAGEIWITIPNPFRGRALMDALRGMETAENPEHKSAWHPGLIRQVVTDCGFQVLEMKYFTRSRYRHLYVRVAQRIVAALLPAVGNENIFVRAVKA